MKKNKLPKEYTMRHGCIVYIREDLICTLEGYDASNAQQTSIWKKRYYGYKVIFHWQTL